ncbi:MAG: DinB family protein [Candidatus Limnocylindria bacterium]
MMTTPAGQPATGHSPLHEDLLALLRATRAAERELFAMLAPAQLDASGAHGAWSARDVQAHLAAWRAIEARRLDATARGEGLPADDPAPEDPIDESNARLHAERAGLSWASVREEADASVEALIAAIARSSTEALCECDGTAAGIGANAANHAIAHLSDIAQQAGAARLFDAFSAEVEAILRRGHLPVRDSGVMLYNIACHRALSGELDEARRLLRAAFARRHDLVEEAVADADLAAVRADLPALAAPAGSAPG